MTRIIADSTCDLSKELVDRFNITIVPLHILLGQEEFKDGVTISPEKIYEWADKNHTTPKTSAPNIEDVCEIYKPILDAGDDIIAFSISDTMSTSGNVLRLAASELDAEDRVSVINSENLSTGIGLLVIEAAIKAAAGKDRVSIVNYICDLRKNVRSSFVVDTLTYLHRGGRCSGLAAMAGGVLKLHPRIEVNNGIMGAAKKYRGKMDKVIMEYVKDLEDALKNAKEDRVFITHSTCDEVIVKAVYDYLENLNYFKEIHITVTGGVVASHCGPGTLGVLFISK